MNFKRIKTTAAAGILAASMILPNMTAFAAGVDANGAVNGAPQIEKTVEVATGVSSIPTADQNITFLVHQVNNASGSKNPTTVSDQTVTIPVGTASASTTEAFAANILTDNVINGLTYGEYSFEVTETTVTSDTDFGWTTVDKDKAGTYYLRVVVKADNSKNYFITKTNGDTVVGNKLDSVDFTNVYNKKSADANGNTYTLGITNQVKDEDKDYIDPNNTYPTTVVFTVPAQQTKVTEGTSYTAKVVDAAGNETQTTVSWSNNGNTVTISADLKDGEKIVVDNIAVGATYTVTENETSIKSKDANFTDGYFYINGQTTSVQSCENQAFAEASQTVVIENDFQNITITGVVTDIAPYVTLVVVAVAAIAAYLGLKKRVAR